jgi:hypothetical protein
MTGTQKIVEIDGLEHHEGFNIDVRIGEWRRNTIPRRGVDVREPPFHGESRHSKRWMRPSRIIGVGTRITEPGSVSISTTNPRVRHRLKIYAAATELHWT